MPSHRTFPPIFSLKYFSYTHPFSPAYIIQILGGMIIGIGAFKPLRKMVVVVLLHFLLARRLHNALLSPISFSHRLQPFLYYFHNSLEIKRFFPLNLFQKCFPTNYTCCVCSKTFSEQLQFGIVCKPSIIESRLNRII